MITSAQLAAARGLVGWSQVKLAEEAQVGISMISRMEGGVGPGRSVVENFEKVQHALESAGVQFIEDGTSSLEGGPGVRLRTPRS